MQNEKEIETKFIEEVEKELEVEIIKEFPITLIVQIDDIPNKDRWITNE